MYVCVCGLCDFVYVSGDYFHILGLLPVWMFIESVGCVCMYMMIPVSMYFDLWENEIKKERRKDSWS